MDTITEENRQKIIDEIVRNNSFRELRRGSKGTTGDSPMSLSFAGCGFNGLYHLGVASCFREYAPLPANTLVYGASAGALAALALCLRLPLGMAPHLTTNEQVNKLINSFVFHNLGPSTTEILSVAIKARSRALGPFHPWFNVNDIIFDGLVRTLPEDAHIKASGQLHISLTRVSDGKNVVVNQYDSKEDLIRVCINYI